MTVLRLPPLPTIRDLLKLYRLSAIKRLSQNFLLDERITDRIIKKVKRFEGGQVLEVGPGPGCLTRSIMKQLPKRLVVVEKDTRFKPTLEMLSDAFKLVNGQMDIIYGDILRTDLNNMFPEEEKKSWQDGTPNIHVIGNLPFSVSTHLIIRWLQAISEKTGPWEYGRTRMLLTFQKEVAERLVAQVSDAQRCRLSVMAQAWTFPTLHFVIPGKAFVPKPDVDVGVVSFTPLVKPRTTHDFQFFEKVTRHTFSFRQKYNIKCAETLFPPESRTELAGLLFKLADIEPTLKSIHLTVEDIDRIATAYKYILNMHPEIANYDYRASHNVLSTKKTGNIKVEEYTEDCEVQTSDSNTLSCL